MPDVDRLPAPVQLRQWLNELYPATLKELALGGGEVQQLLERRPGPWMKPLLQRLLFAAALGRVQNTKEALAAYVLSCEAEELS
ncbi:putative CCA tRNA nucleotidyltransferase [Paenibacillus sp. 598K]|nr:putative CCA tRNA nucleotidyltransferase [Paenibacillus sp. 598K]